MIKFMKLDTDDIIEIVLEHYQDEGDYPFARGLLLGTPGKDLRLVCAFDTEENSDLKTIDLNKIDTEIDFNGDHAFLAKHPEFYL